MDLNVGDIVKRNSEEADWKGNGLSPPTRNSGRWESYFNEKGKIIEVETKYGSICAVRVRWERGAVFRYDQANKVLILLTPKSWLEDELFEI